MRVAAARGKKSGREGERNRKFKSSRSGVAWSKTNFLHPGVTGWKKKRKRQKEGGAL